MTLSAYAQPVGVTDQTAAVWWQAGQVDADQADQLPIGTIRVHEAKPKTTTTPTTTPSATGVALAARGSSAEQRDAVTRHRQRVRADADAAAARGEQGVLCSHRDRLWSQ
jgi:predicted site-specific integrase-resolvase